MALFWTTVKRESVSLLSFPFFINVHVFLWEMSLNTFMQLFFFLLLFSGYFRSFDPRMIRIVSSGSNKSSSMIFYVVFKSLYRCVYDILDGLSLECEWLRVSRILLGILAYHNPEVVWMFSTHFLISNTSSVLSKAMGSIPSTLITIGITVTFTFLSFLSSLASNLFLFSLVLFFTLLSAVACWIKSSRFYANFYNCVLSCSGNNWTIFLLSCLVHFSVSASQLPCCFGLCFCISD